MAGLYKCMFCQAEISLDDVNVTRDVALCRSCGKTMSFSLISGASEITTGSLEKPPRWVRVDRSFDGITRIVYRRPSLVGLLFFIPFTAFWSGFSVWGIYGAQIKEGKLDIGQALFGLPFLFGTVVLLGIILYMLFGKWIITLNRASRGGSVFAGLGRLGWTRQFTYNRESIVSLEMTNIRINDVPQKGISVNTEGKKIIFGASMTNEVKAFIAATIMQEVNYA